MTIYRDQLEAVYRLIEKPENWTQNTYARDAFNEPIAISHEDAVCWCLRGAVLKVTPEPDVSLCELFGVNSVLDFNDHPRRTHSEVLALLQQAIDRAPVREVTP